MRFSKRINIPSSATLGINALALQKKKAGERVFNLSAGEVFMPVSPHIQEAAIRAIQEQKNYYTPVAGIPELRDVARNWFNARYGASYFFDETFVTNGGKFALYAVLQALLNPGDEAIIIAPYWVSYSSMVQLAEGVPIILETKQSNDWKITPEKIASAITEKTKILLFNNAANPTGALYTHSEVRAILEVCTSRGVIVISDEVYGELVYDGQEYASCALFPEYKDNVIIVHSASKMFAMTGWRVGFVFASVEIIKMLTRIQGQSTSNTTGIAQWATVAAFQYANEIVPPICSELQHRRDVFVNEFETLFSVKISVPKSALYVFLPLVNFGVNETDSVAFCADMLEKGNIATVPGASFGAEGFVRCSFGVEEQEICAAFDAIKKYIVK